MYVHERGVLAIKKLFLTKEPVRTSCATVKTATWKNFI